MTFWKCHETVRSGTLKISCILSPLVKSILHINNLVICESFRWNFMSFIRINMQRNKKSMYVCDECGWCGVWVCGECVWCVVWRGVFMCMCLCVWCAVFVCACVSPRHSGSQSLCFSSNYRAQPPLNLSDACPYLTLPRATTGTPRCLIRTRRRPYRTTPVTRQISC